MSRNDGIKSLHAIIEEIEAKSCAEIMQLRKDVDDLKAINNLRQII
jgi:hypothetical protein